jgi:HPt (histidine-containing phosphotransfer) domain-containing protein
LQLRSQDRWSGLPVIAMTANALESDRQACLAAGMTDHVGKPFDLDDLVGTLLRHARPHEPQNHAATTAASTLPDLPLPALRIAEAMGVDAQPAVSRLGGNVGTYGRMWRNFLQDLGPLRGRLDTQLAQSQWAEAAAEVHTLKGLAGMLGQAALVGLCRQAEAELNQVNQSPPTQAWLEPLRGLIGQLEELGPGFVDALVPRTTDQAGQLFNNVTQVCEALGALTVLLAASDMKAMDALEPLRSSPVLRDEAHFAELCVAMDRLDFERAGRLVSDLMRVLNA